MNLRDIKSIAVRDVSVVEGRVLFRVVNGRIDRLRVSNEVGVALTTSSSDLVFSDCWFRGGAGGNTAIFGRHSTVEVYSTVFAAPTEATEFGATVVLELAKSAQFRGCEFQVVEPWTVLVRTPADWVWTSGSGLDLRQNYWGTTDSLEIERLVYDAGDEDHPEYPSPGDHPSMIGYSELERVQFWPVLDNLVRSSSRSIGGLKSRFRERR
jgi:hypothetical protein